MFALVCLQRISLRGPFTKSLFDPVMHSFLSATRYIHLAVDHKMSLTFAAVAHATNNATIIQSLTAQISSGGESNFRLSCQQERSSRQHLQGSGFLRPGESLLMYLGLCSSENTAVSYVGFTNLAIILDSVSPHAFSVVPFDSVSARIYTQEAIKAKRALDFALTGKRYDPSPKDYYTRRPHALLVDCVLRLANHRNGYVRCIGLLCLNKLPREVLCQAIWSPSMYWYFGVSSQELVVVMLILCHRGDLSIPVDLVITNILPFACDLP